MLHEAFKVFEHPVHGPIVLGMLCVLTLGIVAYVMRFRKSRAAKEVKKPPQTTSEIYSDYARKHGRVEYKYEEFIKDIFSEASIELIHGRCIANGGVPEKPPPPAPPAGIGSLGNALGTAGAVGLDHTHDPARECPVCAARQAQGRWVPIQPAWEYYYKNIPGYYYPGSWWTTTATITTPHAVTFQPYEYK